MAICSSLLTLQTQNAEAGVVYRWVDSIVNLTTGPITGRLVVRDDYWFDGATIVGSGNLENGLAPAIPGIESFTWSAGPIFDFFHTAASQGSGFSWNFDIQLSSTITGGRLYVDDRISTVQLNNMGGASWRVGYMGTDRGGPCFPNNGIACQGGLGTWVLDLSTLPVSEPTSLLLAFAGMFALAGVRSRSLGSFKTEA